MKSLGSNQAHTNDLYKNEYINLELKKPDPYPSFEKMEKDFRKAPLSSVIKYERKSFFVMFVLHTSDILCSISAIYLAMQILATFEVAGLSKFKLIEFFITNPTLSEKFGFALILAFIVFILNMIAASFHAQKLEREMFLEWRIPTKFTQTVYHFLLNMSARDREKYQSGDITNIVQNDAGRNITGFFAHAFVDFAVIFIACGLITLLLMQSIGWVALFGLGVILLQIPLSLFFAWVGVHLHQKLMQYSDKRIHSVTELIQGMRLLRYLSWGPYFEQEIKSIATTEFFQDTKLAFQFCISFSIIANLWMFISSAIFAGYLMVSHGVRDASVLFGIMWLAKLFGHQIAPLPWFLHTLVQSIVASRRIRKFFASKTQAEEFLVRDSLSEFQNKNFYAIDSEIIENIINKKCVDFSISFEFDRVSFQYRENGPYILKDLSFTFPANETCAIVGPVGAGKSTLIKILIGEYIPTKGHVFILVHANGRTMKINLHSTLGIRLLRSVQSLVPQEPFIVTSTIRENIAFDYHSTSVENQNDDKVMNSLLQASLLHDLSQFPDHLETEIGERGVNLSGGQRQRVGIARKFYQNSKVVFMDDPFSAVDSKTEKEIVDNIFGHIDSKDTIEKKNKKTIIWTTHRLEFLNKSDRVLELENGVLHER